MDIIKLSKYYYSWHCLEKNKSLAFSTEGGIQHGENGRYLNCPLALKGDNNDKPAGLDLCGPFMKDKLLTSQLEDLWSLTQVSSKDGSRSSMNIGYPLILRRHQDDKTKLVHMPLIISTINNTSRMGEESTELNIEETFINYEILNDTFSCFLDDDELKLLRERNFRITKEDKKKGEAASLVVKLLQTIIGHRNISDIQELIKATNDRLIESNSPNRIDAKGIVFLTTPDRSGHDYIGQDLHTLSEFDKGPEILKGLFTKSPLKQFVTSHSIPIGQIGNKLMTSTQLEAFCASKANPIVAVAGPPGTGKSFLLANVVASNFIHRALEIQASGSASSNFSTVICSNNNKALAALADTLDQMDFLKGMGGKFCLALGNREKMTAASEYLEDICDTILSLKHDPEQFKQVSESLTESYIEVEKHNKVIAEIERALSIRYDVTGIDQAALAKLDKLPEFFWWRQSGARGLNVMQEDFHDFCKEHTKLNNKLYNQLNPLRNTKFLTQRIKNHCRDFNRKYCLEEENEDYRFFLPAISKIREILTNLVKDRDFSSCSLNNYTIAEIEELLKEKLDIAIELRSNLLKAATDFMHCHIAKEAASIAHAVSNFRTAKIDPSVNKNDISYSVKDQIEDFRKIFEIAPAITTTFHSIGKFCPELTYDFKHEVIDTMIIDESGQCMPHIAIGAIARARHVMIVGDVDQIKPIVNTGIEFERQHAKRYKLQDHMEDISPGIISLQGVASNSCGETHDGRPVMLREHFRCRPDIINFCNELVYNGNLIAKDRDFNDKIRILDDQTDKKSIGWVNVSYSKATRSRSGRNNPNEAARIIEIIEAIIDRCASTYNFPPEIIAERIGIVTPFSHQARIISKAISKKFGHAIADKILCGTVHALQGQERDIIFFSTVYSVKDTVTPSKQFFNLEPNMLNVAVSRAREYFIVVGNKSIASSDEETHLNKLHQYIEKTGFNKDAQEFILSCRI